MSDGSGLADPCGVAFKEWAGVCEALGSGVQTLILRKGGISEGPDGFRPEHSEFWLYPTHLHEGQQGLRVPPTSPQGDALNLVEIDALAQVRSIAFVDQESTLAGLHEFHVWTQETIRKRFHYRSPGLWVLGVRVYRRPSAHSIRVTQEQLGCKSWVPLDPPLSTGSLAPALEDEEFARRMDRIRTILEPTER
ncbi:DUF1802 family protein [Singulisphaera rosea]